jgi:ELWxxDGT repeat protein
MFKMFIWIRRTFLLLSTFSLFLSFTSSADKVELIANINQTPIHTSAGQHLTSYQNKLYFVADDGVLGEELYAYDPKTAETSLIADINIGEYGSNIHDLLVFDNKLYFFAFDGSQNGLYQYDELNNVKVLDRFVYYPRNLIVYNDELYFTLPLSEYNRSLFKYDEELGKSFLKHSSGSDLNSKSQLLVVADKLYMILPWDYHGGIFVYDNETDKTALLDDVAENYFAQVMGFTGFKKLFSYSGKLYVDFASGVAIYNPELNIITNATPNIMTDSNIQNTILETIYDNNLLLSISTSELGYELYNYNIDTNEYYLIADINPGEGSSYPTFTAIYDNKMIFTAEDSIHGRELFSYDFDNGDVKLEADLVPGPYGGHLNSFISFNDKVYVSAYDGNNKLKIFTFRQDLSTYSATVNFLSTNTASSLPSSFIEYNQKLYFSAYDNDKNQIYHFDSKVKEVVKVSNSTVVGAAVKYHNKLYYANKLARGLISYSEVTNTTSIFDNPVQGWPSRIRSLTVSKDKLYFISYGEAWYSDTISYLYEYNPETDMVTPLLDTSDPAEGPELLFTGPTSNFTVYQNDLYFLLYSYDIYNDSYNFSLQKYDLELAKFISIYEDSSTLVEGEFQTHYQYSMFVEQDKLYFRAPKKEAARQFFVYDGNTQQLAKVEFAPESNIAPTIYQGKWYFPITTQNSSALNIYDTETEQSKIVEVAPYNTSKASPFDLIIYNNKLYFKVADNDIISLYNYDLSTQAISLISGASNDKPLNHLNRLSKMKVYKNKLYFSGLLENHGYELFSLHTNHFPEGSIKITGSAIEHQTITVVNNIEDADVKGEMSYQWYRDNIAIDGETSNNYLLTSADVAKSVTVAVSYYDGEGTFEQATSNSITPIRANVPNDKNKESSSGGSFGFTLFILAFVYSFKQREILKCLFIQNE